MVGRNACDVTRLMYEYNGADLYNGLRGIVGLAHPHVNMPALLEVVGPWLQVPLSVPSWCVWTSTGLTAVPPGQTTTLSTILGDLVGVCLATHCSPAHAGLHSMHEC